MNKKIKEKKETLKTLIQSLRPEIDVSYNKFVTWFFEKIGPHMRRNMLLTDLEMDAWQARPREGWGHPNIFCHVNYAAIYVYEELKRKNKWKEYHTSSILNELNEFFYDTIGVSFTHLNYIKSGTWEMYKYLDSDLIRVVNTQETLYRRAVGNNITKDSVNGVVPLGFGGNSVVSMLFHIGL